MNAISIQGKITENAKSVLVKTGLNETPLVTFVMTDYGLPYKKSEPMSIEVNFMKEAAENIKKFLVVGKDVTVFGHLTFKIFTTRQGRSGYKYYINADYVIFSGKAG